MSDVSIQKDEVRSRRHNRLMRHKNSLHTERVVLSGYIHLTFYFVN